MKRDSFQLESPSTLGNTELWFPPLPDHLSPETSEQISTDHPTSDVIEQPHGFLQKTKAIGGELITDFKESENRFKSAASLAGMAAVQAVGATRAPSLLALPLAAKVQHETGIPLVAGGAAGALYGGWSYAVARVMDNGINHLPRTCAAIHENVPNTDILNLLPGLDPSHKQDARTRASRGLAAYTTGISLYLLAAGMQDQSRTERRKLSGNLGRDAGVFLGVLATGATAAVMAVQQQDPGLAEKVMECAQDSKILVGLLVGGLASKAAYNWVSKQTKRQMELRRLRLATAS